MPCLLTIDLAAIRWIAVAAIGDTGRREAAKLVDEGDNGGKVELVDAGDKGGEALELEEAGDKGGLGVDLALTDVAGIVGSVALRGVRRRELNVQNDNGSDMISGYLNSWRTYINWMIDGCLTCLDFFAGGSIVVCVNRGKTV